jgi:hypothetical protein
MKKSKQCRRDKNCKLFAKTKKQEVLDVLNN